MRAAGWVFLLCLPSVALADIPPAQDLAPLHRPSRPMREAAQQHYQAGERFFRDAQFDAAIVEFEAAYKLSGEPDMVYTLSRTSEKAGKVKEALEYAARYQTLVVGTDEEERAQRRIEFLRGRYSVEQAQPKPPEQSPAKLAEQPPAVATAPDPAPNVASAPPSPPPPKKARKVPPGAIGLLAGGGALTLAGVGLLAGAWATGQQAQAQGVTYEEWSTLGDRGRALNTGGIALSIVGGALVVGGAVWAIVPRARAEQPQIAE